MRYYIILAMLLVGMLYGAEPITFKLAGLKLIPVKWDKKTNFEKLEKYTRRAVSAGAQFVVAGEGYLEGYVGHIKKNPGLTREQYLEVAEPIDGPWIGKIRDLAYELNIWLVVGLAVSVFQAISQIHEMTLTFIPKIVAIFASIMIFGPWIIKVILNFAVEIFTNLCQYARM